jgi:hypothetical protein
MAIRRITATATTHRDLITGIITHGGITTDGNLGAATTHVQSTGDPGRNLVTHAATQPTAPRIAMP